MRTRRTRAIAEAALARLVAQLDGRTDGLVVVGGLNPELLAPVPEAPHQGTADIDLVVQLGFVYDRDELDLGWLEAALDATGFVPVGESRAWQWVMTLEDTPIRIDLLTDVLGRRADRDPYDLAFVVQHNTAGGPRAAARAARAALPPGREQEFEGVLRAALAQLTDSDGRAARLYATQRVADGDPLPVDVLAADAAAAARQCLAELDLSPTTPPRPAGG